MTVNNFPDWLNEQISMRGWSLNELARRAGVSVSSVSLVLSGQRKAGPDFCNGIARAINVPADQVFRLAGILPSLPSADAQFEQARHYFNQLTESEKDMVLAYMRTVVEMKERKRREQGGQGVEPGMEPA